MKKLIVSLLLLATIVCQSQEKVNPPQVLSIDDAVTNINAVGKRINRFRLMMVGTKQGIVKTKKNGKTLYTIVDLLDQGPVKGLRVARVKFKKCKHGENHIILIRPATKINVSGVVASVKPNAVCKCGKYLTSNIVLTNKGGSIETK